MEINIKKQIREHPSEKGNKKAKKVVIIILLKKKKKKKHILCSTVF